MKCRLIKEIGTRAYLRIYWGDSDRRDCPVSGYHNAMKLIGDSPNLEDWEFSGRPGDYPDEAAWPTHCQDCGAQVPAGHFLNEVWGQDRSVPKYQVLRKRLYDTASGQPEPGNMYWAPWYHGEHQAARCPWDNCNDPRGHLIVVLPTGHEWDVDSRASNCDMKNDRTHRCWVRHGEPPDVHVDKNGHTCGAGAGSIAAPGYHGFLHYGELTSC